MTELENSLFVETLTSLSKGEFDKTTSLLKEHVDVNHLGLNQKVELRNQFFAERERLQDYVDLMLHWARLEKQLGMNQAAMDMLNRMHDRYPEQVEVLREIAWLYLDGNQLNLGFECLSKMVKLAPADWRAWNDGGCILRAVGNTQEAVNWMTNASKACQDNSTLHANLALLYFDLHNYTAAQQSLDTAFALDKNNPEALHTQAMVYGRFGRHKEAKQFDEQALAVKPDYPQARLSLALVDLTLGDWTKGFAGYESRWVGSDRAGQQKRPSIGLPQWGGHAVYPSSRIVVFAEQGLGDQLQFARFIPALLKHFNHVDWVVPESLVTLMEQSFRAFSAITIHRSVASSGVAQSGVPYHLIDFECQLMSLPLALGLTLKTLPSYTSEKAYLKPDATLQEQFNQRLKALGKRLKVGIAWSGRPTLGAHALRMVDPTLLQMLDHPEIDFINLQKVEQGTLNVPQMTNWFDWMPECHDFAATAALVSNLDLVICTDTSIAHLSGALGKPTWMLNRLGSEWRWLDGREDSPWYPNMRLFNQETIGDWKPTLEKVKTVLMQKLKTKVKLKHSVKHS